MDQSLDDIRPERNVCFAVLPHQSESSLIFTQHRTEAAMTDAMVEDVLVVMEVATTME